jgi:hypothetical protein
VVRGIDGPTRPRAAETDPVTPRNGTSAERDLRCFVGALDEDAQAAIDNQIARLNMMDGRFPHLPFPRSS